MLGRGQVDQPPVQARATAAGDPAPTPAPTSRAWWSLGTVLFLLGSVVALWRPRLPTIWFDEAVYRDAGVAYLAGDLSPNPEHPPLAKVVFGVWMALTTDSVVALRVLVGLVTIATALVMWWWAAHLVRADLAWLPGVAWLLMAHHFEGEARLDRLASLDVVMVFFLVAGSAVTWHWWETRRLRWALAAGALLGCAVACKIAGVFFLPVLLAWFVGRGRERAWARPVAAFLGGFLVVVVAAWLPFGGVGAVLDMLDYQAEHNERGHLTLVAGQVVRFAGPLDTVRLVLAGLGVAGTVALLLGSALFVVLRPSRLAVVLLGGTALALGFFALASNVALPHYYLDWAWAPTFLTGTGLALAIAAAPRHPGLRLVAAATGLALVVSGATTTWQVLTSRSSDFSAAAALVADADGQTLVEGVSPAVSIRYYVAEPVRIVAQRSLRAVVVGHDPRTPLTPTVQAFVDDPPRCVVRHDVGAVLVFTLKPRKVLRQGSPTAPLGCRPMIN